MLQEQIQEETDRLEKLKNDLGALPPHVQNKTGEEIKQEIIVVKERQAKELEDLKKRHVEEETHYQEAGALLFRIGQAEDAIKKMS